MAGLVLGRQIIDTGPCTDGQASNMAAIASLLDAMGNPGLDPGPGPNDEPQGKPVEPVYIDDDGLTTGNGESISVGSTLSPGCGISIDDIIISVKLKENGGIFCDNEDGLSISSSSDHEAYLVSLPGYDVELPQTLIHKANGALKWETLMSMDIIVELV